MERTLVALWFADIAGYSEHAAKDESSALSLVEILQELASETVPQFRGRVVKFVGDAVLAQFPSAELAVRAAIALSNEYVQRSDAIGRVEHLRIGVATFSDPTQSVASNIYESAFIWLMWQ